MARDDNGAEGLLWFLVGVAVGAGVALLYAPKSGKETRELLTKKAQSGKEYIEETTREAVEKSKELYDRGKEMADEAAEIFERGRKLVRG